MKARQANDMELIGLLTTVSILSKRMANELVRKRQTKETSYESNQITERCRRRHERTGGEYRCTY
ncbi:MAG TPA: hypothetical protein VFC89_06840 [Oscillospiraceae bacterium]|nr:hypothetical protein [Oscillospiraceae bacterium]